MRDGPGCAVRPAPNAASLHFLLATLLVSRLCCHAAYDVTVTGRNWTSGAPTSEHSGTHNFTLCMMAIVKNEGVIIEEWLRHYLWQGVDHVYLIDNNSTDNTPHLLTPYVDNGTLSYFLRPERHHQRAYYLEVYQQHARAQCAWMLVVDVDEYVYHRQAGATLASYVRGLDALRVAWVHLRWRMFGSSGHITQPRSVRLGFLWRKDTLPAKGGKVLANTRWTVSMAIHNVEVEPQPPADMKRVDSSTDAATCADIVQGARLVFLVEPGELALNHYPIMSLEYFQQHKIGRGSASRPEHDHARDMHYFAKYDHKAVRDLELLRLVQQHHHWPGASEGLVNSTSSGERLMNETISDERLTNNTIIGDTLVNNTISG